MKYIDVRPKIKTGDLLVWSHGGWSTWHDIQVSLVRMFTQSEFSHVGLAFVSAGRGLGPEALEWAFQRLGDRYSKWQAIKAFLGGLRLGEDDLWECAEYVLGILRVEGEELTNVATPTGVVKAAMQQWGGLELVTE